MGHLSHREMEAFFKLGSKGDLTWVNWPDGLLLSVSSATVAGRQLREKGLVVRSRSLDDRRVVRVGFDEEGPKSYNEFYQMILDSQQRFSSRLRNMSRTCSSACTGKSATAFPSSSGRKSDTQEGCRTA